jgi:DNA-binding response OmpR family regulator
MVEMSDKAVLLVGRTEDRLEPVKAELRKLRGIDILCADSEHEAALMAGREGIVLIVVLGAAGDREDTDRLLCASRTAKESPPVLVVTDCYSEAQAITYFQMGVADYLSITDHVDRLSTVAAQLTGLVEPAPDPLPRPREVAQRGGRSRKVRYRSR